MRTEVVILAAGKGTRMHSAKPKVLHCIGGKAMIEHVVDTARCLEVEQIHLVLGFGAELVKNELKRNSEPEKQLKWAQQDKQLGTGHALAQAMPAIAESTDLVLVLYGDVPLIKTLTLKKLISKANHDTLSLLTLVSQDPKGLGRIIRDDQDNVVAIVEEKDASGVHKKISETNSGIMVIPARRLAKWLPKIANTNNQGEFYLTDIIAMAVEDECKVTASVITNELEVLGVNDKIQLSRLERHYQIELAQALLKDGITLRDPNRIDIRGELVCGEDVEIDINTIFEGKVNIGNNVKIGANTVIKDSRIGNGVVILPGSIIDTAIIANNSSIGPMARLRPGTVVGEGAKIGNFVETKKARIGAGSKISHLSYIGDAELGVDVNVGAGTIVCNYDGVNKHTTTMGDRVFVGSNSVLVSPVNIADDAFIAAGSTVNSDVEKGSLAVARAKQRNIPGWKRPVKKK
ncbi:MAG: UDP-N-acetylglucosamine diphosphorylase/glucosamine-1-phosphate N-acetyltransferase [SAR86 cluster bacterium]|uniref:Bifunctional protein GlmU n=1 Tax=SAR86 cluster bacterium TaxID=2030880 RepID=A0A2A4MTT9_9GAMM|nr:MAG: UDP-N-acetylglucosamine diphosphorylase/glucosamine-1-phosphate N-acetyltransferase [SAR86 cluster bacterium]